MADTGLFDHIYNPDVLSCLANLSNDEVFTPPDVANAMLDLLPQQLFRDPHAKFLDPACKTGVFLREIAKRLITGLQPVYPDLQERLDHIFHEQLYGIAITELTSLLSRRTLYCSKYPNSKFSVSRFDAADGNVRFKRIQHTWSGGRCAFCGAAESQYRRSDDLETHAYEFIHRLNPEEIFNMHFDVIISNPPYQLSDSGYGKSARPIYQLFVQTAQKLKPRFISMIIPSRWFSGGRGLDSFRQSMMNDKRIKYLVDYENFKDVFPGVDLAGGACYFLWDREYSGNCYVSNCTNSTAPVIMQRSMNEFDVFVRSNNAVSIVRKVLKNHPGKFMDQTVSPSKPFGLRTFYQPREYGIPCQFIQKIGLKYVDPNDVDDPL